MPEFKMTEREARAEAKRLKDAAESEKKAKVLAYHKANPDTPAYYYRQRWGIGAVVVKRWLAEIEK
jgi:hypothetical protein